MRVLTQQAEETAGVARLAHSVWGKMAAQQLQTLVVVVEAQVAGLLQMVLLGVLPTEVTAVRGT